MRRGRYVLQLDAKERSEKETVYKLRKFTHVFNEICIRFENIYCKVLSIIIFPPQKSTNNRDNERLREYYELALQCDIRRRNPQCLNLRSLINRVLNNRVINIYHCFRSLIRFVIYRYITYQRTPNKIFLI